MRAWHFTGKTLRDGSPIPAPGVVLRHTGQLVMCESDLHASLQPFDALQNAPGDKLHLVECGGTIQHQNDKLVCTERTIIVSMDAGPLLRYFARQQALSVVHLWDAPDVVLDYLMGDDTAWAAARAAAYGVASSEDWYSQRGAAAVFAAAGVWAAGAAAAAAGAQALIQARVLMAMKFPR